MNGCWYCGFTLGAIVLAAVFWNRFGARVMFDFLVYATALVCGLVAAYFVVGLAANVFERIVNG